MPEKKYKSYRLPNGEVLPLFDTIKAGFQERADPQHCSTGDMIDAYFRAEGIVVDCVEMAFMKQGRNYVFCESEVVDFLYHMEVKAHGFDEICIPFGSFALSIDSNSKINGLKMPPVMVVKFEHVASMIKDLSGFLGNELTAEHEDAEFCILIPHEYTPNNNDIIFTVTSTDLTTIIEQGCGHAICHKIVQDNNLYSSYKSDFKEEEMLTTSLKLVIGFLLYNQISESEFLLEGFPEGMSNKPKRLGFQKDRFKSANGLTCTLDKSVKPQAKSLHIRSGYYRQLTNERYYKGQYADWKRGTRWVKVSPALIGKGTAYEQSTEFLSKVA